MSCVSLYVQANVAGFFYRVCILVLQQASRECCDTKTAHLEEDLEGKRDGKKEPEVCGAGDPMQLSLPVRPLPLPLPLVVIVPVSVPVPLVRNTSRWWWVVGDKSRKFPRSSQNLVRYSSCFFFPPSKQVFRSARRVDLWAQGRGAACGVVRRSHP